MDLYSLFVVEHRDAFIAARLESARYYRQGAGSPIVAIIGRLASGMRRAASRIEAWAQGSSEQPLPQPHQVSAR
ncbi:MAG: hypothetical protein ABIP13_07905 [Tepidiformaceae bacterium]